MIRRRTCGPHTTTRLIDSAVDDDCKVFRRRLREQLELLAAPADQSLAGVPDGCVKADELALDFDNDYDAYVSNWGEKLSPEALAALRSIDELFDRMSDTRNPELWTEEAVKAHPAWSDVRRQAALALRLFNATAVD